MWKGQGFDCEIPADWSFPWNPFPSDALPHISILRDSLLSFFKMLANCEISRYTTHVHGSEFLSRWCTQGPSEFQITGRMECYWNNNHLFPLVLPALFITAFSSS